MTILFINALEATYFLLIFLMLFRVRKLYLSFAAPGLKTRQKILKPQKLKQQKSIKLKRTKSPALKLNRNAQSHLPTNYYYDKLPEPEVSISSDQDIAFLTKKTFKPKMDSLSKNKDILNSYIDDFFPVSPSKSVQKPDDLAFLNYQISSPSDDEIITVVESNSEIAYGQLKSTPQLFVKQ